MNSGKYRFPGTVYRPATEKFRTSREREPVCNVWVSVEPSSAAESIRMDGIESTQTHVLRCVWFPIEWDTSWYIELHDGRRFSIGGVINVDEMSQEWLINATVEERANHG